MRAEGEEERETAGVGGRGAQECVAPLTELVRCAALDDEERESRVVSDEKANVQRGDHGRSVRCWFVQGVSRCC